MPVDNLNTVHASRKVREAFSLKTEGLARTTKASDSPPYLALKRVIAVRRIVIRPKSVSNKALTSYKRTQGEPEQQGVRHDGRSVRLRGWLVPRERPREAHRSMTKPRFFLMTLIVSSPLYDICWQHLRLADSRALLSVSCSPAVRYRELFPFEIGKPGKTRFRENLEEPSRPLVISA